MKTLDETIKAFECCNHGEPDSKCEDCPYNGIGGCILEREADALHHLKEYKRYQNTPSRHGHMALVDYFDELQKNEPLTWDELKNMTGKPVWIVPEEEKGYWFVIEFFNNNPYYGGDRVIFTNDVVLNRCDLGKTWQAYRKERG